MAWAPDYLLLEAARKWIRIKNPANVDDDDEIEIAISAASRAIDKACNRQFGKTTGAEERFYTAWFDDERWRWIVDVDDFQSAVGLVVTIGGVATTDYTKEPVNAAAEGKPWEWLSIDPRTAAVVPTGADHEVGVTANPWGWTAFPVQVPLAARIQMARFLKRREAAFGIAGSPEMQMRLLSKLDPDVELMLGDLVRPRKVG